MEDTIIVRGARPLQKINNQKDLVVQNEAKFTINEDDISHLRSMSARIDELSEEASFLSEWRQQAEADYSRTRDRVTESEKTCSMAVVTAQNAGQSVSSISSKVSWLEMEMSSKNNQIADLRATLDATTNFLKSVDVTFKAVTDRIQQLEMNDRAAGSTITQLSQQIELFEARSVQMEHHLK